MRIASFLLLFAVSSLFAVAETRADVCTPPGSTLVNAVCADDAAKTAYVDLIAQYQAALGRLSPEGKVILKSSQKKWERRFSAACTEHLNALAEDFGWPDHPLQHCLAEFTSSRASFLQDQGRKAGDFNLQDIDDDQDLYCSDTSSTNRISASQRTVRIDAPKSAAIDRWNDKQTKGTTGPVDIPNDACKDDGESDESVTVGFADGDFVQIVTSYYQYFNGMPHGQSGGSSSFELVAAAREVNASDIFKDGSGWQGFVSQRLYADYRRATTGADLESTEAEFKKIAEETFRWSIDKKTLTYGFGQYDLGGYADAIFDTSFTWRELRPYLRADLPFHPDFGE